MMVIPLYLIIANVQFMRRNPRQSGGQQPPAGAALVADRATPLIGICGDFW